MSHVKLYSIFAVNFISILFCFCFHFYRYLPGIQKRTDPRFVELRYSQAVFNVITKGGDLGTDEDIANLAALQYRIRFPESQVPVVGSLVSVLADFIPQHMRATRRDEAWEDAIFKSVKNQLALDRNDKRAADIITKSSPERTRKLQLNYITIVEKMDWYGCTTFPCFQSHFKELPASILVGIEASGVSIWTNSGGHEPMERRKSFELKNIYRWGYEPGRHFYVEVSEKMENGTMILFRLENAPEVHGLLQDYAMALLDEEDDKELEEVEAAKAKVKTGEVKPVLTSDRTDRGNSKQSGAEKKERSAEDTTSRSMPGLTLIQVVKIQSHLRGFLQRNALHKENAEWSAVLIQSTFRGYVVRMEMDVAHLDYAVSKIQAIHRGNQVRKDLFENEDFSNDIDNQDTETIESGPDGR